MHEKQTEKTYAQTYTKTTYMYAICTYKSINKKSLLRCRRTIKNKHIHKHTQKIPTYILYTLYTRIN